MDIKEKIKAVVVETLDYFVDKETLEWPPGCSGIFCQPERPKKEE